VQAAVSAATHTAYTAGVVVAEENDLAAAALD